jgi:hypothetical protein
MQLRRKRTAANMGSASTRRGSCSRAKSMKTLRAGVRKELVALAGKQEDEIDFSEIPESAKSE